MPLGASRGRMAVWRFRVLPAGIQKLVAVPSPGSEPVSIRSGQSAALMSQNRHSWGLGTRLGGVAAARRRIVDPSLSVTWSSRAPLGTCAVRSGYGHLTGELGVAVTGRGFGHGLLVDHDLDGVLGLFLAGFHVDDEWVVASYHYEVGRACRPRWRCVLVVGSCSGVRRAPRGRWLPIVLSARSAERCGPAATGSSRIGTVALSRLDGGL